MLGCAIMITGSEPDQIYPNHEEIVNKNIYRNSTQPEMYATPDINIIKQRYDNPYPDQHPTAAKAWVWMNITELGPIEAYLYYVCEDQYFKESEAVETLFYIAENYRLSQNYTSGWRVRDNPRLNYFKLGNIGYARYEIFVVFVK